MVSRCTIKFGGGLRQRRILRGMFLGIVRSDYANEVRQEFRKHPCRSFSTSLPFHTGHELACLRNDRNRIEYAMSLENICVER